MTDRPVSAIGFAPDVTASQRIRRRAHTTRVPSRMVIHARPDNPRIWVAHEITGTCEKRGDAYCYGNGRSTTGAVHFVELFARIDVGARRRWDAFVTAMQARGKDFG